MQSLLWRIGSKIRLKWTVPWFSVFVDQTNLKIIWKISLSQYRCHKTPDRCRKLCYKCIKFKSHKTKFYGDYYLRNSGLPPSCCQYIKKSGRTLNTKQSSTHVNIQYKMTQGVIKWLTKTWSILKIEKCVTGKKKLEFEDDVGN